MTNHAQSTTQTHASPTDSHKTPPPLIQQNIPLHDKNWFQTGGPARYYAAPTTVEQFQQALQFARAHSLPIFVLGKGANVLISDAGFNGLVIHPQLNHIEQTPVDANTILVTAGSGVAMEDLITYCLHNHITGLEEFSGIPGTIGGSVYINLHYFEFLLEQFLVSARVVEQETGNVLTVDRAWFNFGYNQSTLQQHKHYLIDATFQLKKVSALDAAYAHGRAVEIARHRAKRYPVSHTCGSFFRNFHSHEVTLESNGKKIIFVAYYLDKIGVKGALKVGDATVSHQHANMLVNCGKAASNDLITLARTMQDLVHKQFGIMPQPECLLIGFDEWPLHKKGGN